MNITTEQAHELYRLAKEHEEGRLSNVACDAAMALVIKQIHENPDNTPPTEIEDLATNVGRDICKLQNDVLAHHNQRKQETESRIDGDRNLHDRADNISQRITDVEAKCASVEAHRGLQRRINKLEDALDTQINMEAETVLLHERITDTRRDLDALKNAAQAPQPLREAIEEAMEGDRTSDSVKAAIRGVMDAVEKLHPGVGL